MLFDKLLSMENQNFLLEGFKTSNRILNGELEVRTYVYKISIYEKYLPKDMILALVFKEKTENGTAKNIWKFDDRLNRKFITQED